MGRKKKETLKKRADGRYRVKYKGLQFYGRTEEEAMQARDAFKAQESTGFSQYTSVSDYALPWLARTFPTVSDSTYTGLAIHLQHLIDVIGNMPLSSVVPSDIKRIYSTAYLDRSNSYIKSAKQLFCTLFDAAVADGLCRSNPARDRSARPHRGSDPRTRPITAQERHWIDTLCHDSRAYPAVCLMLYAGLRPQEVKAFRVETGYDEERKMIIVCETAHKDGNNQYEITGKGKTKLANREIPALPPVIEMLKGRHGSIIESAHGKQITKTTWNNAFTAYKNEMETAINGMQKRWYGRTKEHKRILASGGSLPEWITFDVIPYNLRHSFCVMCRDAGIEMNTCRKWMGHTDATMIMKVYDSVSEDRSDAERLKLENLRFGVQNGVQHSDE